MQEVKYSFGGLLNHRTDCNQALPAGPPLVFPSLDCSRLLYPDYDPLFPPLRDLPDFAQAPSRRAYVEAGVGAGIRCEGDGRARRGGHEEQDGTPPR